MKFIIKILLTISAIAALFVLKDQAELSLQALQRIDPLPHAQALVAENRFAEADGYLDFFMEFDYVRENPQTSALHAEIKDKRSSLKYQATAALKGFIQGKSDETVGQISGAVSDFLVIGDVRDLGIEGWHYIKGEEVDEVLMALSAIGVAATGAQIAGSVGTVATAGAASPTVAGATTAKTAVVTLKVAKRLGKLPNWLIKQIKVAAKAVKESKSFAKLSVLFDDIAVLARTRGGLELLSKTDNADDLRKMARFSEKFEDRSVVLYRLGGTRAVEAAQALNKEDELRMLRAAATYGDEGVSLMKRLGVERFGKVLAKKSYKLKFIYKHAPTWLLKLLAMLPSWALLLLVALGGAVWLPWLKRLWRPLKKLAGFIARDKSPAPLPPSRK